jgi:hypothetical protein
MKEIRLILIYSKRRIIINENDSNKLNYSDK